MPEATSNNRVVDGTSLPPDGTLIRVSPWRRQVMWVGIVVLVFVDISVLVKVIELGRLVGVLPALASVFSAIVAIRMSLSGVMLLSGGVKARNIWWTYHWQWNEIERFELRERGETPRFRIRLRDGKVKGFLGFFARSSSQEERGQALFRALEKRLEDEHAEHDAQVGPD